jgi:Tfp pilus assembly protein PilX
MNKCIRVRIRLGRRSRGIALPIVLLMSSMLLVTAAAWLEAALVGARATTNLGERVQAFHSADSALIRCAGIALDSLPELKIPTGPLVAEPNKWRLKASFEGASASAVTPFASWPYAIRPPQCLIEEWPARTNDQAGAVLITARGFSRMAGSESWLQQEIEMGGNGIVRHWRRVVAKPFQEGSP